MNHPWFMEQPQFKSLFDQASAIKNGKLLKMNKEGKAEVAKQIIAANDDTYGREQTAELYYTNHVLRKKLNEIQAQLNKVAQEEELAAGGGGGCCCVVL